MGYNIFPRLQWEVKWMYKFLFAYVLGQQDISGVGNSPRSGWDVGRGQAQGVELHGEQ